MSFSDLPYASQVLCCCTEHIRPKPQKFTPDPRLQNWEKWMRNRKETNDKMEKRLDLHAEQLLFNYSEDLRAIHEDKTVFENTNIIYPHDKYRGNPAFWNLPHSLHRKPCRPDYFSVMTKEQKYEIPSMEYVGIPTEIRYEKDTVSTGYRNPKDIWNKLEYRQQRTKELAFEIQNVEPYKPDLSELFIKGVGFQNKPKPPSQEPSEVIVIEEDEHPELQDDDYLLIGNCKLYSGATNNPNVYLNFEYDLDSRELLTKTLDVENGTPYALRYYLDERKNFFLFRDIAQETQEQVFFYDKRELIMLPYQTIKLPITFKTEYPLTYKMQLEIKIRPKLWEYNFVINLVGIATFHDLAEKSEQIKLYIDSKAHESVVKDTIYDILRDVPPEEEPNPIFYIYDKAMIFEAVNQNFSPITQRPKYIYIKEVVEELEQFYAAVRSPKGPATWNFNIEELRAITKQKQELEYQNRFVDELLVVKTQEEDKKNKSLLRIGSKGSRLSKTGKSTQELKGAEKSEKSLKKSKSSKSQTVLEEAKKFGKNLMTELENILLKLEQPSIWVNENEGLHESCYAILCTAMDVIMKDVTKLETDLNITRNDKYPSQYTYNFRSDFDDRNKEIHDDLSGQIPRIEEDFIKGALPPAECLKDIPFDECDARYKSYYGIVEETLPQKGKKKGKKAKSPKKEKKAKKDKKGKKGKGKKDQVVKEIKADLPLPDINLRENTKFKISEELPETSDDSERLTSSDEDFPSELPTGLLQNEYKRSLYDIFYKNLLSAVLGFTDIIELRRRNLNKSANIQRMLNEVSSRDPPAEIILLDLKQALRFAFKLPASYQEQYSDVKKKPEPELPKYEEPVQVKEEGSEWSILRPLKQSDEGQKPISYPECNVYLKRRIGKRIVRDIGTIMSNAGIHPGWLDIKDIGVQMIDRREKETRSEKEDFISGVITDVVDKIYLEETAGEDGFEAEGSNTTSSNETFYDDGTDEITSRVSTLPKTSFQDL